VAKLKIVVLEGAGNGTVIEAQFNPKDLHIEKSVGWQRQPTGSPDDLKYTAADARVMSFELLLDGYSTATSIQGAIDSLEALSNLDGPLKRPPKLRVVWGADNGRTNIPKFEGVIEKFGVTYTLVDPEGRPLRATVALSLKEADHLAAGLA
jgi:hypothetical protein